MFMKTRTQRINLVQNVVASALSDFINPQFRGTFIDLDSLEAIIKSNIQHSANSHGIAEKHHEQMVQDGIKFYNRHLKSVAQYILDVR